jgi:hypothetical protein
VTLIPIEDPAREQFVIRYYQCLHRVTADAVLRFPKAIKEETEDRVICGVYYGYLLEQVRIQDGGYLATRRVFDSPHERIRGLTNTPNDRST